MQYQVASKKAVKNEYWTAAIFISLYISTVVNSTLCEHKNKIEINENASKIQMLNKFNRLSVERKTTLRILNVLRKMEKKKKMKLKMDFIYENNKGK